MEWDKVAEWDWHTRNVPKADVEELDWWRHFASKCFNNIPVGRPLLGDRFKIVVQNPFTDEWEDVWTPKSPRDPCADTSTAENPQLAPEQ